MTNSMHKNLRLLHSLIILLLGGSILASCFDDTEVDYGTYNDLAVTSAIFGTLPRTVYSISAISKKDTAYESTLSATNYMLTIDQLNNTIYNVDSLPYGIHPERIIFSTFNVTGGAVAVVIPGTTRDTTYAPADTLDFSRFDEQGSRTRTFNLYGIDGTSRRSYKVDVRIHQQKADSLTWRHLTMADWDLHKTDAPHTGYEYAAAGINFRLTNGQIESSTNGTDYEADPMVEEDLVNLPDANLTWVSATSNAYNYIEEVLLYGTQTHHDAQTQRDTLVSKIWRRNIDTTQKNEYAWDYFCSGPENSFMAPGLKDAALYTYDKGYLLVGIRNNGLLAVLYSADRGRTWKNHTYLRLPADLKSRKCSTLQSALDKDSNLWLLIDDNEVWYGRAHSVSWKEEPLSFTK